MKKLSFILLSLLVGLISCGSDEDQSYPDLITEMAMAQANDEGLLASFVTDRGRVNNTITGMEPNERLRALLGYVPQSDGTADVYTAKSVPILPRIHNETPRHDPIGIESVWMGGGFLNMHLLPKTQGEKQAWAFICDSTRQNPLGGTTHHLSLYHNQQEDVMAYSSHLYACLSLDSVATSFTVADSIVFAVVTFNGLKTWQFGDLLH